jgi:putative FmdB family regulatory protein
MPIYEFICTDCEQPFEELVLSSSAEVVCPSCGSDKLERAMSTFSYSSGGKYSSSKGSGCDDCSKGSCSGCSCGH